MKKLILNVVNKFVQTTCTYDNLKGNNLIHMS